MEWVGWLLALLAALGAAWLLRAYRAERTRAAELLGMSFRSLRYRIKKLNIE